MSKPVYKPSLICDNYRLNKTYIRLSVIRITQEVLDMKCKVNPKLQCTDIHKTGSGKWNHSPCPQNCPILLENGTIPLEVGTMPKKEKQDWIKTKLDEAKQKQAQKRKEAGMEELFNMPIGETEIQIDTSTPPRTAQTKFGDRDILRVTVNGKPYDWMINPNSPLYRDILQHLYDGHTHFIIVRSGMEKQTRYSIKKAW